MEESKLGISSFSHIRDLDEVKQSDRYYLRYYMTIKKARKLNQKIYGDEKDKGGVELKVNHPLRIACLTEEIKNQRISDYHMSWLVGILHDAKEDDLITYSENIDDVLVDLLPQEKEKVMMYIDQLTSQEWKSKGQKKEDQIKKMQILDLIPCWIRVFDKYDNCRRFKSNPVGNSKKKIDGYCAIAYLCYKRACQRFEEIQKNLQPYIHEFYRKILAELGGQVKLDAIAQGYINQFK